MLLNTEVLPGAGARREGRGNQWDRGAAALAALPGVPAA